MDSLPVMDQLSRAIYSNKGPLAYSILNQGLTEIYVPFVRHTDASNALWRLCGVRSI